MGRHKYKTPRTAYYYTYGELSEQTEQVWFVFHGYGQRGESILHKFSDLDASRYYVIALEGLSRFYWEGVRGDVVCSWMTSYHRCDEIEDYIAAIEYVYARLRSKYSGRVHVMGFSQGCATLWRWIGLKKPLIHKVLLWAGSFPNDIEYVRLQNYLSDKTIYYIYGLQDEYLTTQKLQEIQSLDHRMKMNIRFVSFDGGHRVDKSLLWQLIEGEDGMFL